MCETNLDDPARVREIRQILRRKGSLRRLYHDYYERYRTSIAECPEGGVLLEIGSGGGFAAEVIQGLVTSDVLPYEGVERVIDATRLPFEDETVSFVGMLNVFHHIPDVESFLREAQRVLKVGGRLLIVDEHPGLFSKYIYKWIHHEPFDDRRKEWSFPSSGPLSGANGALTWMVFVRDRELLRTKFPKLRLVRHEPHTPLRYWLAGGLKKWSLLPERAYDVATTFDELLLKITPELGSLVDVELVRTQ